MSSSNKGQQKLSINSRTNQVQPGQGQALQFHTKEYLSFDWLTIKEKRWLVSQSALKLDQFKERKDRLEQRLGIMRDKFVSHVELLDEDSIIFEGDLQLMITIAKNENEFAVAEKMAIAYMKQIDHSTEYSYSGVGANIMRMCHQANDCDRAERMYENQVLVSAKAFSLSSQLIFGDLLYENGKYDKLVELFEKLAAEIDQPVIFYMLCATYFKQNTRESYEKMLALTNTMPASVSVGAFSKAPFLNALLALRQGEPKVALDLLQPYVDRSKLSSGKCLILMWAEAESGHLEDLYKTIARFDEIIGGHNGVPIFVRLLQRDTIVLDTHLLNSIKAAVLEHAEDETQKQEILSKISTIESLVVLEPGSIDKSFVGTISRFTRPKKTEEQEVEEIQA